MKWLASALLVAGMAFTATAGAEEDPWGGDWQPEAESSTPATDEAEATEPERIPEPPSAPDSSYPPMEEDTGTYMFLAEQLTRSQRIIVLLLIGILAGYLLPAIFYLPLLRRGTMDPGPAAGLCLGVGLLMTGWAAPLLLATSRFQSGALVPWFLQADNWMWSGLYYGPFLLLALVAFTSRAPRS